MSKNTESCTPFPGIWNLEQSCLDAHRPRTQRSSSSQSIASRHQLLNHDGLLLQLALHQHHCILHNQANHDSLHNTRATSRPLSPTSLFSFGRLNNLNAIQVSIPAHPPPPISFPHSALTQSQSFAIVPPPLFLSFEIIHRYWPDGFVYIPVWISTSSLSVLEVLHFSLNPGKGVDRRACESGVLISDSTML
jgi:hypothetical protein